MRLTDVNVNEFRRLKSYRPGKAQMIVKEFIDSGKPVMKVEVGENEYANSCGATNSLKVAIESLQCESTVGAVTKNGTTYLYNPQVIDE